jgi:hypothetical protein
MRFSWLAVGITLISVAMMRSGYEKIRKPAASGWEQAHGGVRIAIGLVACIGAWVRGKPEDESNDPGRRPVSDSEAPTQTSRH